MPLRPQFNIFNTHFLSILEPMKLIPILFKALILLSMSSGIAIGHESQSFEYGYVKVQYGSSRVQAEQILEETRIKLQDMLQRRGGNSQTILLTGDMVRNWKLARDQFDAGNYAETIRICNIVQKYIY